MAVYILKWRDGDGNRSTWSVDAENALKAVLGCTKRPCSVGWWPGMHQPFRTVELHPRLTLMDGGVAP